MKKVKKIKKTLKNPFFGHGSFVVWGYHFRSTFIASRYKFILNKACIKGEEVEKFFSGSRIRRN